MSRNIRKTAKVDYSDSSSLSGLSDDDGYSAVEEISDDEDADVEAAEAENILTEALYQSDPSPRPLLLTDELEEDAEDEDDSSSSWGGIADEVDDSQASDFYKDATAFSNVERHVRFDVPSSDSDSTDTDDDHADMFPDIFVAQTSLDPAFRREIEDDPDDSSDSNTCWDNYGIYTEHHKNSKAEQSEDDTPMATPKTARSIASSPPPTIPEEPQELDGYETDGDTTEEDIPEPPVRRKTRRLSFVPSGDGSDSEADMPVKGQRGQPRVGRFSLDKSDKKPIAVVNPLTRKVVIFTPHRHRQLDLSPEQFNLPWAMPAESPLLSNSAHLMLSAMISADTFGDYANTHTMGPAEAFFPWPEQAASFDDNSSILSGEDADEDDAEKKLNFDDFIICESSDDENGSSDGEGSKWRESSTPRPTTASSDLAHINSDTVGAFRRNQIEKQLLLSNTETTADHLAFSDPFNFTVLRGIKKDRVQTAAGAPLTPIRRQKRQSNDFTRSPLEAASTKRKASAEVHHNTHKKQRSISDVNNLHL